MNRTRLRTFPVLAALLVAWSASPSLSGMEQGETATTTGITISPDGRLLACARAGSAYLYDFVKGNRLAALVRGKLVEPRLRFAPDGSTLLLTIRGEGGYDIALYSIADRRLQPLTKHLAKDYQPTFVLGGEAIAFVSYRDGQSDIYLLRLSDRHLTRLTDDPLEEEFLSTDATGTTLAFLAANEVGRRWLSLLQVRDGERLNIPLEIPGEEVRAMELSPDGRRTALVVAGGREGVYLLDLSAARRSHRRHPDRPLSLGRPLPGTDRTSDLAFSPDGRRLAYTAGGRVYVRGFSLLSTTGRVSAASASADRAPAWDPTGKLLALAAQGGPVELRTRSGRHLRWFTEETDQRLAAARIALKRGDEEGVVLLLKPLLSTPSRPSEAADLLARALYRLGRTNEALETATEAGGHLLIARLQLAEGRFEEALEALKADTSQEARLLSAALPNLDGSARHALRKLMRADLRGRPDEAADALGEFCRTEAGSSSPLAPLYAFRRVELLAEIASGRRGLRRRWAFSKVVKTARWALDNYPSAPPHLRETALRTAAAANIQELNRPRDGADDLRKLLLLYRGIGRTVLASGVEANVALRLVRLHLETGRLSKAEEVARGLADWSFRSDATALRLCRNLARLYDRRGFHSTATAILERLVAAYHLEGPQVALLLADSLPLALLRSPQGESRGMVPGLDVDSLPGWFRRRAERLLRACSPGRARQRWLDVLQFALAKDHRERQAIWSRLTRAWQERGEGQPHPYIRIIADVVLGEGSLKENRLDAALDYFADLADLLGRPAYRRALEQYKVVRRQYPKLVADWLMAERKAFLLYLPPDSAAEVVGRALFADITDPTARRRAVRHHWSSLFHPLLSRRREGIPRLLKDNFLYRAALLQEGAARRTYLRTLLTRHPDSEFAVEAFRALAGDWLARGNYLMAARLGETLIGTDLGADDAAQVKRLVARIYDRDLLRPDLASTFYRDLADNYVDSPQWQEAQYWMAHYEANRGRYDLAVNRLRVLIERAPDSPPVADGSCQYDLATALRLAGRRAQADAAYLRLIRNWPQHPVVRDPRALAGIWQLLSPKAKRSLIHDSPNLLKRILPHLPIEERKQLKKEYPDLLP